MGFNPRPRVGGDSDASELCTSEVCFNPRPRVGGDLERKASRRGIEGFNPRPRVGGDTDGHRMHIRQISFNPRPRVGGDKAEKKAKALEKVSIRAPAWGATVEECG